MVYFSCLEFDFRFAEPYFHAGLVERATNPQTATVSLSLSHCWANFRFCHLPLELRTENTQLFSLSRKYFQVLSDLLRLTSFNLLLIKMADTVETTP
jgi:hypothetical protein